MTHIKHLASPAAAALALLALAGCQIELYASDPAGDHLNESIAGDGDYTLDDPEVDESIEIQDDLADMPRQKLEPGMPIPVTVNYVSPNANVVGVGIRFGRNGPVIVKDTGTGGQQSGSASATFMVPPEVCDSLSQICHDIQCYEFAVTDIGQVSRENIMDVALACGKCDEPSCQDLLDECSIGPDCEELVDQATAGQDYGDPCIANCADRYYDCIVAEGCTASAGEACYDPLFACLQACY